MAEQISFTLSEQDYVDASRSQYSSRWKSPKQWAWAIAILIGLAGLFAYLDSWDLESFIYNSMPYLGIVLLFWLLCPFLGYLWVGRWARRMFRQQKLNPENRMWWNDEGLRIESDLGSLKAKWGDFYSWKKAGKMFMVHINEALYYVVPDGALTAAQAADLEGKLKENGVVRR